MRVGVCRSLAALLAIGLATSTLAACVPLGTRATANVGGDGFKVAIEGVQATGPSGVAENGTTVTLEAIDEPLPAAVESFASVLGTPVSLSLDGAQPNAPIEVRFQLTADESPVNVFVIGEDPTTGTGVSFVDSEWDQTLSTVIAQVEHLSWFAAVTVSEERFSDKVSDWIEQSLGTESAVPDCFGESSNLVFSQVADSIAWPCATALEDGADWSLQSNSGLVWEVLTEPTADYRPLSALSIAGVATAAVANQILPSLDGEAVLLPLETLHGHFAAEGPYTIGLRVEPGLSQVATLMFGLSMMFPTKWMRVAENAECLFGVVRAGTSSPSGETLRSILSCVGTALTGAASNLIAILLAGPGLLVSQLEGIAREITQTNTVQFTLSRNDPNRVQTLPNGASWLHELASEMGAHSPDPDVALVPIGDVDILFANSTNQWVGCDGDTAVTTFYLDDKYSRVSYGIGLQEHAPQEMVAEFRISVVETSDRMKPLAARTTVAEWSVQRGTIVPRQTLSVEGVWSLTIEARTSDACESAPKGYGALLDAYVE